MVNSDWNIVFKLKDFIDYLTNNDSIQLSMSSKKLRKPLIKDSFKTFNFSSFTSTKDYSSLFIKRETNKYGYQFDTYINPFKPLTRELIEFRKEFCNDLKLLNRSPKNLLVNDYGMYHYLLNEIPSIFPNITTLVLDGSVFTVDTFQYLLDNFKSLENLEITHSSIFLYLESSNDYTFNYLTNYHVNYPISLRNFKTIEFMVIMVKDNVSPFSKNHFCGNNVFEYDLIHQHLPNLVSFDYGMENDWPDESEDLINFIKLNSQLNSLKLCGSNFKFELFDIIKDFENLTHLEFKCFNFWEDLMDYEMPVLYNIKNLHIEIFQENIDAMSL
ncbi:hypothetical protein CONCODRAFT_168531 [Conidiobolus coronatus NRRL 28638]|uniref:F-box domain-containing protein n=1 Tax=Conidiobolus coronatus (strain ATCC 28846 / CBS 209.66 / NRRL 28638) TaxID=796925 RepID=A0A137NU54_CONC2|nr:hypothetical protein CONCODRAFT_168531 [Conidiobolus coronatus NRRL 28638]|eukprot:KXN66266.1 hypothetical protein CONCODRAFT_168531 [Conidiobolus coronatus NRRL 28638]